MHLDPATLSPAERYKLLIGCIVPRPIAFVSTLSAGGAPNLAPFSFFNGIGSVPMTLLFCPVNGPDGQPKDTLRNLLETADDPSGTGAECVVNIVSARISRQMAACAEPLPYGQSEWELCGLTPVPARVVRPVRVAEAAAAFECRVLRIVRLAPGQAGAGNVVIAEVVGIHLEDGLANERLHIDPARLDAIGRMGGLGYCHTRDRFEMPMGRAALAP